MKTFSIGNDENVKLVLFLLKNIKDTKTFRNKIISGEIDCCALKPSLIVELFQIVVAANKAVRSKQEGKLKTKSLNTELLFNLSITKNITQSLNTFGIGDKDKHAVVAVFEENGDNKFELIKNSFEGDICDIEEISKLSNVDAIKKTYKITDKELEVSKLIDSVVSRIATKDFGSF